MTRALPQCRGKTAVGLRLHVAELVQVVHGGGGGRGQRQGGDGPGKGGQQEEGGEGGARARVQHEEEHVRR